jgi:hypothetical protein
MLTYKYPEFAQRIVDLYQRDYYHSTAEEFGIDKSLLLIHAANSMLESGHRSFTVFLYILTTALLFILTFLILKNSFLSLLILILGSIVSLYFIARKLYKNLDYRNSSSFEHFNPTQIPPQNCKKISEINTFTDGSQPKNIFIFSTYNPFSQFGTNNSSWSFLIDRRKSAGGEILPDPAELDIDETYSRIVNTVVNMKGVGVSRFRFHLGEILLIDGKLADAKDSRLFEKRDYGYYPRQAIEDSEIHILKT